MNVEQGLEGIANTIGYTLGEGVEGNIRDNLGLISNLMIANGLLSAHSQFYVDERTGNKHCRLCYEEFPCSLRRKAADVFEEYARNLL